MTDFTKYPLCWPNYKPRTRFPKRSRFTSNFNTAVHDIYYQLRLMGARDAIVSTDIPLRNDGLPYASHKVPQDKGAAVYFTYKGNQMAFCCDKWDSVSDNLHAINKTIDALRGIERWGSGDMMEAAFSGFQALPSPDSVTPIKWWQVLGVDQNCSLETAENAFKNKAKAAHPDNGGDHNTMAQLNCAIMEARFDLG